MSKRDGKVWCAAVLGLSLLASASGAGAQQSKDQQKCINALNKGGRGVAVAQGKENVACLQGAGKGTLGGGAQACLTADAKGKVQKAEDKTLKDETKLCGTLPGFGYTGGANVNEVAMQGEIDLTADVFGADLGAAVIDCDASKAGCRCQQKVQKSYELLVGVKLAEFVKCKKAALAAGASSAASLVACIDDPGTAGSIAADSKGKVAKAFDNLNTEIVKQCDTPGVTVGAFPGDCAGFVGPALSPPGTPPWACAKSSMLTLLDSVRGAGRSKTERVSWWSP